VNSPELNGAHIHSISTRDDGPLGTQVDILYAKKLGVRISHFFLSSRPL